MVAYSFKARFIQPILDGSKGGTIRAKGRRRHAKPSEALQLYTGMRTRQCALILRTMCGDVAAITMVWRARPELIIAGEKLAAEKFDGFARFDGFTDFDDLAAFWRENHPDIETFEGQWIKWFMPISPVKMGDDIVGERRAA